MQRVDRIAAIMMLAVSIIFWAQMPGLMNPFSVVFPRAILTLLTITSLVLLARTFIGRKPAKEEGQSGETQEQDAGAANAGGWKNVIISIVVVAVWIALLDVVGFYVTSVLAFALLAWLLGRGVKQWREGVVLVAIIAAEIGVFYVIFAKLLLVPLPTGLLF